MISPIIKEYLGSIIRAAMTFLAGYLVTSGVVSESEATTIAGSLTLVLTTLAWSFYEKYRKRGKLQVALGTMKIMTEAELEEDIRRGRRAKVSTPKTALPQVSRTTSKDTSPPAA